MRIKLYPARIFKYGNMLNEEREFSDEKLKNRIEFDEEEHVKIMGNIINAVREIRNYVREYGKITFEDAEKISKKHNIPLHLPLAELASTCMVDYKQGIILCHD